MKLSVGREEPFKVCQLTDLHLGECPLIDKDLKTLQNIDHLLSEHEFDLIMITGDVIWGKDNKAPEETLQKLFDVLNKYDVPAAITYGNHDAEGQFDRQYLRDCEEGLINPATKTHSYVIDDRENYTLEIFDEETNVLRNVIYVWDSGSYSKWPEISTYAAINRQQINWYIDTSRDFKEKTLDIGFMHIPLPEYKDVDRNKIEGLFNKRVTSPSINSGLFYELINQNKIKAIYAGHDHDNNFSADYDGINLNYGNVTGYNAYGDLDRGVLEIDLYNDVIERKIIKF